MRTMSPPTHAPARPSRPARVRGEGPADARADVGGAAAGPGVLGGDRGARPQPPFAGGLVGGSFIFRGPRLVSRTPGMSEVVRARGERARHDERRLDAP